MANIRIIEQPEITTLSGNEYLVTDSPTVGTKKITPQNLVDAVGGGGSGVTDDLKAALLQIASKVAYIDDDGQEYYDDLYDALYPPKTLTSISAVYTQSGTVYPSTSLDTLKSDLVVTAHYDDTTSETVTTYTLSGTLTVGTSVVTVSYSGKTTTFNVTVSEQATVASITAVYTQSGTVYDTDSLDSLKADLVVTAVYTDSSTEVVPSTDYTLSGVLAVGTSVITVNYGGKTDTFSVTVTDSSVLPATYEAVEYIYNPNGSTSSPPISTGLTLSGTGDVVVDVEFTPTSADSNPYILGCMSGSNVNTIGLGVTVQNSNTTLCTFSGTVVSIAPSTVVGVKHSVTATFTDTGASITDGTLSSSETFTPRPHNAVPIYLFGVKYSTDNTIFNPFRGKLGKVKITENNQILLDLQPCVRLSDGAAGFYDFVSQAFITDSLLVAAPSASNTTAEVEMMDTASRWSNGAPITTNKKFAGVTKKYDIPSTTALYPAGIVPYSSSPAGVFDNTTGIIALYDSNDIAITNGYVQMFYSPTRWVQNISGSLTEYSHSWTAGASYTKIQFQVDVRYMDDAYMYHEPTGLIFFAGKNTPYYGKTYITD